MLTMLKS